MENGKTYKDMIEVFKTTEDNKKRKDAFVSFIKTTRKKDGFRKEIHKRRTDSESFLK